MSTLMKWLVMLVIWFLVSLAGYYGCVKECCHEGITDTEEVTPPPAETSVTRYPVDSKLGYAEVNTTDQFAAWKDEILGNMEDGKTLEVEGLYYASETAPDGFDNMGLARAAKTIDLLAEFIPRERMRPVARLVGDGPEDAEGYFLSAGTRWVEEEADLTEEEVISVSEDEKIILFPNASAQEIVNQEVVTYLDSLALHLNANPNDRVQITGHASRVGDPDQNVVFSRRRARRVSQMLLDRGVDVGQVTLDWKGDTQLADPGDSEAAHRRNRRAVIKLTRSGN